jgi:translocation and assembly module TamB
MEATATPPPRKRKRRRVMHISLGAIALLLILLAAGIAYLLSEAGLPFLIARVVAQSGGRLTVEGASGSIGRTMRFRRLVWRGEEVTVTADDVALDWNPGALTSLRLSIRGLGAQRIAIAIKPSQAETAPPKNLTLPLDVTIEQLAVAEILWQAGPQKGHITGLEFSYAGNADRHAFTNLKLVSELGALSGNAAVNAHAPLDLGGTIVVDGDGPLLGARIDAQLGGTIAAVALDGSGRWHDATLNAHLRLAPFATNAFESIAVELQDLTLARVNPSLPNTHIAAKFTAQPDGKGLKGSFEAANSEAGTIDASRVPVDEAQGSFALRGDVMKLEPVTLHLVGGGRAEGRVEVDFSKPTATSRLDLSLRDVDLKRLHARLVTTRLSGKFTAVVGDKRQTIHADLTDANVSAAFDAVVTPTGVDVTTLRARAGGGSVEGTARMGLEGTREFNANLAITRFDPSRFGAFPAGNLDGTLVGRGRLQPSWSVTVDLNVRKGSRLHGAAITATGHGTAQSGSIRDLALEAEVGSAQIKATGAAGNAGDRLAFSISSRDLAELKPLVPETVPAPLQGVLKASGTLALEPGGFGGEISLSAERLKVGDLFESRALDAKASLAPGGLAAHPIALEARNLTLSIAASDLKVVHRPLARAEINGTGTFAQHTVTLVARGDGIDATARLSGTLDDLQRGNPQWKGTLAALENRGPIKVSLTAPATLEISAERQRIASAHLTFTLGRADIDEIVRDHARITSRGSFARTSVANVAKFLGRPLPLGSTLTLGGQWNIAAAPRLNGTFAIARDGGDLFGQEALDDESALSLGFGITELSLTGDLENDALDARATFRSQRVGSANATLKLGSIGDAVQGHLAKEAPLAFALDAELASLQPLQPWIGTAAAIDGRATAQVTARGTLGNPQFTGMLAAEQMRIDAPAYGVSLRDGSLRAHLVDRSIVLDTLEFTGGDGRFTASGTLARASAAKTLEPSTRIAWHAEQFRVMNRPDMRFVVGGNGTLAIADKRLVLAGAVKIEEGHIEYEATPPGRLGSDVVVKGWPPTDENRTDLSDLPLTLDVDVDLGTNLTFVGEGLETGLTGKVKVTTSPTGNLLGHGTIRAVNGTYYAFGQRLTIDRGRLIFDGPLSNPALDVVALRKNLAVEAGVKVTGTVRVPTVTITSEPPVPHNEALAWLVTGQGLSQTGSANFGALSAASAALLSRGGKPITTQFAQSIGLDDISIQSTGATTSSTSATQNQVIFFGKRLTERLTLGYEQGLSLAGGAVRLDYALTRVLTLRAEAGPVSGIGIYYRRSFR